MPLLGSLEDSPRRRRRLNALHEQEEERLAAQDGIVACDDTGIDDLASTSNWMRRTKWAETYRDVDRRLLLKLRQVPAEDGYKLYLGRYGLEEVYSSECRERQLAAVDRAVDRFFSRCEDTIRHTDHSVLCLLRGQIVGRPYKAPFDIPARRSTIVKYRRIWKSMLFLGLRLFQVEPQLRHEFLRFTPSRAQSEACQELLAALQSMVADPASKSYENSTFSHAEIASRVVAAEQGTGFTRCPRDSELRLILPDSQVEDEESHMDLCIIDESSRDGATDAPDDEEASDEIYSASSIERRSRYTELEAGDEASPSSPAALATLPTFFQSGELVPSDEGGFFAPDDLDDAIGKFSYHLCTEEFDDGLPSSTAIVYFSGVLGFTPDGSIFERPGKYTPKLSAMIYCIRLCVLERMLPRFSHPKIRWSMRPRTGGLKHFTKFRDRFMCHGCQSSTGELLCLRSYGCALPRADGPKFRLHWDQSGDTVGWEGGALSMDQLRGLGRKVLERAQHSMDHLFYGTHPIESLED
jgi:hypothetical protein